MLLLVFFFELSVAFFELLRHLSLDSDRVISLRYGRLILLNFSEQTFVFAL